MTNLPFEVDVNANVYLTTSTICQMSITLYAVVYLVP